MWMLYAFKNDATRSKLSNRKVVRGMFLREEVINIMTNAINEMNREIAINFLMPSADIEQMLAQSTPELNRVNGMLYDLLKEHGVIP
jgi:hypothetical protein